MNHLSELPQLQNRYLGMRHSISAPNVRKIIVSRPENALRHEFGLTDDGRTLIERSPSVPKLILADTEIVTSDLSRARETAEIVAGMVGIERMLLTELLRERDFGELEFQSNERYRDVWELDEQDPDHHAFGVESANDVLRRSTALILDLERLFRGKTFLLVAHGDVLQILQTGFEKIPASRHRSLKHMENAEIREFVLKT